MPYRKTTNIFLLVIDKTKYVNYTVFMDVGEKLKRKRLDRKETLHKVAIGTDIDMTLLSKIERGERLPTNEQTERIAGYFGLDKKQLAVEVTAQKIISEYGYNDVTYAVALFVQEEMKHDYGFGKTRAKNG